MKDNMIQSSLLKLKAYASEMPKKTKRSIGIGLAAVLLFAAAASVIINSQRTPYKNLYTGLSTSESGSIYATLKNMGADVRFGSDGNIMVPTSEYDVWILQLASLGYPKTALTYDVFSSHSGMTATESEKAQWLLYQLQDRIQATLERMNGVANATVTITVLETGSYVWETAKSEQKASAGVLLTLEPGISLSGKQVSAIRMLVASGVPKMEPEDVAVVDARTMLELTPESGAAGGAPDDYSIGFELMVQQQIEDNVVRLLAPRYGANGVVAVAKVTIDYSRMMTEKLEMMPDSEDKKGFVTHNEGSYSLNGPVGASGVVGEENNTDIPQYAYKAPASDNGMTNYSWSSEYDYNYIKTQIESGNAILKRATISVMVNDSSLTDSRIDELTGLISGCTDIPDSLIAVSAFDKSALPQDVKPVASDKSQSSLLHKLFGLPVWVLIGGALILLLAIVAAVVFVRRRRKARMDAEAMAEERARAEEERRKQAEIKNYKKTLEDIAKGKLDPKNEAIIEEVREFSKSNPQIVANLIRSWLKENE